MVNVAIMGHGVVGSGVAEVLIKNREHIAAKAKEEINIKYILDLREFPDLSYSDKFTKDFNEILNDESVKVVAEVMGGINPAFDFTKSLLLAGKSVVTSNKELVASKGAELLKIANDNNVNFLFEASVGGGIPVLRPISQCLAANDIFEVVGILNGTTNFILTKMIKEKMSFDDALALAQKLGYAERNPAADIEGHDACRKICILASLSFGKHVYPNQVHTEGITNITLADVDYANSCDSVIKLIGRAKLLDDGHIISAVYPAFISRDNQLSSVDDVFNAIMVRGDAIGDVLFYGRGAGKLPTASAVVADIIDSVKHLDSRKYLSWDESSPDYVSDYLDDNVRLYVRATADNISAAMNDVKSVFGDVHFLTKANQDINEFAFLTPFSSERTLRKDLESISSLNAASVLHILD
ncbi:MAG: homoserine dehydrogenase [Oscillospiraceae bacterium]|nr:homoserine dehydrogenase [Oscillospiraceae bacterium]